MSNNMDPNLSHDLPDIWMQKTTQIDNLITITFKGIVRRIHKVRTHKISTWSSEQCIYLKNHPPKENNVNNVKPHLRIVFALRICPIGVHSCQVTQNTGIDVLYKFIFSVSQVQNKPHCHVTHQGATLSLSLFLLLSSCHCHRHPPYTRT